jgi:RNA recognition motif. (a.k.a. RRM, RBD, or RNP domain)
MIIFIKIKLKNAMLKKNLINQHLDHKKQCRWTTLHNKSKDNLPETFKLFLVGLS